MKNKSTLIGLFTLIFVLSIQFPAKVLSQEKLSANTPLIVVNGKSVKLGSAIIAFTKIREANREIDEKTIFSQIIQQLINEELLAQNVKKEKCMHKFGRCPNSWICFLFCLLLALSHKDAKSIWS